MIAGTVIVITGGASGIGLATAQACLSAGWKVCILDASAAAVDAAPAALANWAGQFVAHRVDVRDSGAIDTALADAQARLGPLAGLVNSAAIARDIPFLDTEPDLFREVLDVNVVGAFCVARAVVRILGEQGTGGAIVNISSASGIRGNMGRTAYGASKGAVITMTKVMAVELAQAGIRVNVIAPGPIDTPLAQKLHGPEARAKWNALVPLRRYGTSDEVAQMARILLDDAVSGYVTGQVIAVDGGLTEGGMLRDVAEAQP
ncbi:SDR family NAD(P)-dependent oxidoreductase [Xanthobacteraceae bacterium A53D]